MAKKNESSKESVIDISSDEDKPKDLSNPCGVPHGQKICTECIDILAQSAQLMGKRKHRSNVKSALSTKKTHTYSSKSCVNYSDDLVFCKQNLEACFVLDFTSKLKSYREEHHSEYEGVYEFTVTVGLVDESVVPISTITTLEIKCLNESDEEDEDYDTCLENRRS